MSAYQWDLLRTLTRTEFRMRDQGTVAGFLWTLLHPLFIFAVLHTLFTAWMSPRVENYPAFLLIGIVQWNFFAVATSGALTCLRRKAPLIVHHAFPRSFILLSSAASVLLSHLAEWVVLLAALLLLGARPDARWLLLPALIAVEAALVVGVSCFLSALAVRVRDLERVWGIVLHGLFFLTPVFYDAGVVGGTGRRLVALNPLSAVLDATRALLLGGEAPARGALPATAAFAALLCAAGLAAYPRLTRGVAEKLT
ncbi:MAG: ABC transporter permease [Elusimicrobiota bacterium]|nr:ABC transporter permease [Elusimicrobiota bacterium]